MVRLPPFEVEQWMDTYETTPGVLNIAETCAASLSIADLAALAVTPAAPMAEALNGDGDRTGRRATGPPPPPPPPPADPLSALGTTKLTYGAIQGSRTLRQQVASLLDADRAAGVPPLPADNVIIAQGAIGANYLLFYALLGPGDHVVCVYPTYQQLYSVPASLGAEVSLWRLTADRGYVPDVAELEGLLRPNTKMIILNNPNNPTGQPIPQAVLEAIVAVARARGLLVLSDEVYLPLVHGSGPSSDGSPVLEEGPAAEDAPHPPSIVALGYDGAIATGSMSKAFALAGLRLGWLAARNREVVQRLLAARHYTTISVSQLDDGIARYALSDAVRGPLLRRNGELAQTNLRILGRFVDKWQRSSGRVRCRWLRPTAGTTAFVQFVSAAAADNESTAPFNDEAFCRDVLEATQVLLVPGGRCFGDGVDFRGFVRIGYVCETPVLVEALTRLDGYLEGLDRRQDDR